MAPNKEWNHNVIWGMASKPTVYSFVGCKFRTIPSWCFTWLKTTPATRLRGLQNNDEDVAENIRHTAEQKVIHLELLLCQIANFCPVVSRNTIVKNSTSVNSIWQSIRQHYGFQSSGSNFLNFDNIHLEAGERPEDLFQRLISFVKDNLLTPNGNIIPMVKYRKMKRRFLPHWKS